MNDYEKLREALGDIANNPPAVIRIDVLKQWIGTVQEIANNALSDTSEESEMDCLLQWLAEREHDFKEWLDSDRAIYDMGADFRRGAYQTCLDVLAYIHREFDHE